MKKTSHPYLIILSWIRRTATGSWGFKVVQKSGVWWIAFHTASRRRRDSRADAPAAAACPAASLLPGFDFRRLGGEGFEAAPNRLFSTARKAVAKSASTPSMSNPIRMTAMAYCGPTRHSAIRSAASPSHSGGTLPRLPRPLRTLET